MKIGRRTEQRDRATDTPMKRDSWYATFSLLDIGGAISSAELLRLVGLIMKIWRLTVGRLTDRAGLRMVT